MHILHQLLQHLKNPTQNYLSPKKIFQTTSLPCIDHGEKIFPGLPPKTISEIYAPKRIPCRKHSNCKAKGYRENRNVSSAFRKKRPSKKEQLSQQLLYCWQPSIYNDIATSFNQGFGDSIQNSPEEKQLFKNRSFLNQDYCGDTLISLYKKMEGQPTDEKEVETTKTNELSEKPDESSKLPENGEKKLPSETPQEEKPEEKKKSLTDAMDLEVNSEDKSTKKIDNEKRKKSNGTADLSEKSPDNSYIIKELEECRKKIYTLGAVIQETKQFIEKFKDDKEFAPDIKQKEIMLENTLSELECVTRNVLNLEFLHQTAESAIIPDMGADLYTDARCLIPEKPQVDVPRLNFGFTERRDSAVFSPKKTKGPSFYSQDSGVRSPRKSKGSYLFSNDSEVCSPKKTKEPSLFSMRNTLKTPPISEKKSVLHKANEIPKVIMCKTSNNWPKIVVCDSQKTLNIEGGKPCWPYPNIADSMDPKNEVVISLTDRLNESYAMQEKLVTENAQLEGNRYQLQEEVLAKEQALEDLKRKFNQVQCELKMTKWENKKLTDKLCKNQQQPNKVVCKKEFDKSMEDGTVAKLEKQMKCLQKELQCMQVLRKDADKERCKLKETAVSLKSRPCTSPAPDCNVDKNNEKILQLKEQYARLKDDYKTKVSQVAALQVENENLVTDIDDKKRNLREAELLVKDLQEKIAAYECERDKNAGNKGQACQLLMLEQQLREAKDELEEQNAKNQEAKYQEDYYRGKYLLAQQQVEEQRRQIDLMDADNKRITQQVDEEMQRIRCQFQEKLDDLKSLPELLRTTQCRLQDTAHKLKQSEEKNCELRVELEEARCKAQEASNKLSSFWSQHEETINQFESMKAKLEAWEKKCKDLQETNSKLSQEAKKLEECASQCKRCAEEKSMEIIQLNHQLESVREESARQVAKTKERCETVRRSYQCQVEELERQLAQSRANAHAAQAERDETRKRLQCHISNLSENFEQAQSKIRYLQSHVNQLQSSLTMGDNNSGGCQEVEFCDCD